MGRSREGGRGIRYNGKEVDREERTVYKQTRIRLRAYTIALARDRCASRNPLVTGFDIGASFPAKLLPIL